MMENVKDLERRKNWAMEMALFCLNLALQYKKEGKREFQEKATVATNNWIDEYTRISRKLED